MKKVLGVILGGLLLLPVVSNAADAQKQLITKNRSTPGPVKISWLWTNPSSQLQSVLLKH